MNGVVIVDKPAGLTSHQVVGRARRLLSTRKVGHAGTLDPMATGVLILGVNKATRLLGHLALHDKAYEATIRLGAATVTDDAEGDEVSSADASHVSDAAIMDVIAQFQGELLQVPSAVSAIKVNGRRAYARVRGGEDVVLPARPVTVSAFDVVDVTRLGERIDVAVRVECSSGTYIRALARDVGTRLGVGGHLTSLRRTRIGRYELSQAQSLDGPLSLLSMADAARLSFPCIEVDEAAATEIGYGRALADVDVRHSPTGLIGPFGDLVALYQPGDGVAKPLAVLC